MSIELVQDFIESSKDKYIQLSDEIWQYAELGYTEQKSAAAHIAFLKSAGFTVREGVASIPTAFVTEAGSGGPVIGILGEFDALPGLSQQAVPFKQTAKDTTAGHGCGHHLFGVASMSAAIAIAEQIKGGKIKGTVRFYGCPAEEGGAAKVFMARDGLFADVEMRQPGHQRARIQVVDALFEQTDCDHLSIHPQQLVGANRAGGLDRNQGWKGIAVVAEEAPHQRKVFFVQGNDHQERAGFL